MVEKVKAKDMTEFPGPVATGDAHGKRPADKRKVGDMEPDESVGKSGATGAELPSTTVGEEVAELFADVEGLSEDFVSRASTIFEGAVSEKVSVIRENLEEQYNEKLEEAYTNISEDLENRLDEYLSLFVENYLEENKLAIDKGFRSQIAEDVIESMVSIVESAGVDLDEDKIDVANALVAENEELAEKYNSTANENIELTKQIRQYQIKEAFEENTVGLTEGTKDKLRKLTENINFGSVEQYKEKLEVLKESLTDKPQTSDKKNLTEAVDTVETKERVVDPKMAAYLNAARGSYFGQNK